MYTDETTDYQLEIDAGDEVSVVSKNQQGSFGEKELDSGLVFWHLRRYY